MSALPRWLRQAGLVALAVGVLHPVPAAGLPVFGRIYNEPCGACHTTFPQLNPAGENFRAHGMHGLTPAFEPIRVGPALEVPGTLPLAFYLAFGEDLTNTDGPGEDNATVTHFNLQSFRFLAGGELNRHLAFMFDWELIETEPDEGVPEVLAQPYQAYLVGHQALGGWLGNLKAGWYELPFLASPQIHRLSARPYLIYALNGCTILGADPPDGLCEDQPALFRTQIGAELNALHEASGFGWAAGLTNGTNNGFERTASGDGYLHLTQAFGLSRVGLFLHYNPDLAGHGIGDHALRVGPDLDVYSRRFRILAQFLAGWESNPTGQQQALWYYGGFVEGTYRLTTTLVSLLRFDYAWAPEFDDRTRGGDTRARPRLWEVTGGWQWLLLENLKAVAEVTYGEERGMAGHDSENTWAATLRLVTAFWPGTPPGITEYLAEEDTP